jgi:NADH-quinone oxidoreductase subunit C
MAELSEYLAAAREALSARFGERVTWQEPFRGQLIGVVPKDALLEVLRHVQQDAEHGFRMLVDVTAVDWLNHDRDPRFDVIYQLAALPSGEHLRLKVQVAEDEPVPSITGLWRGANFPEREVFDLFGIGFEGHPNLVRLVMPEDFTGHPLRKDFDIGEETVQFDIPARKRFSSTPN